MASRHILSLDFPNTANRGVFLVKDISIYSSSLSVSCANLQILPPGFTTPTVISVSQGFNLILNACTLGILSTGCNDSCPDLEDGIYHVRYSVSPNDKVYVEYNVLRIVKLMNKYASIMCGLRLKGCAPDAETITKIKELQLIESYIKTAVYLVQDCNKPDEGMDVLKYAIKRLDRFSCTSC